MVFQPDALLRVDVQRPHKCARIVHRASAVILSGRRSNGKLHSRNECIYFLFTFLFDMTYSLAPPP